MMAHFKGDEITQRVGEQFEIFLSRCSTTHAHLEVSANDDMCQTVSGYLKKTATCLTDRNSISAQSTKTCSETVHFKVREPTWRLAQTI